MDKKLILQVTEDIRLKSGGVTTMLKELNEKIIKNYNFESKILTNFRDDNDFENSLVKPTNPWNYNSNYFEILDQIKPNALHLHGIWKYTQYIASKYAVKNRLNYVVSTHGMLEPWLFKNKKLKKIIYINFFVKEIFKNATVLHAITSNERESIKKYYGDKKRIEVIPNLIDFEKQITECQNFEEKYILFLGRMHPIKGIDLLIKSYSKISNFKYKLKIVGPFNDYTQELKKLVSNLNLDNKVEFIDKVEGNIKTKLLQNAFAVFSPSYSEVVGMVNLEAAMLKTPVITTHQTGLEKGWNENGGFLINPNIDEIQKKLTEVHSWTIEERIERGNNLYNFVYDNYSWNKKGHLWKELYQSLV